MIIYVLSAHMADGVVAIKGNRQNLDLFKSSSVILNISKNKQFIISLIYEPQHSKNSSILRIGLEV